MPTSPANHSPEPVRDAPNRYSFHSRMSVRLADEPPAPPKRRIDPRWVLMAVMLVGLVEGSYFFWAGRSALAAAPIFRADESCKAPSLVSSRTVSGRACRLEAAVVVSATYSSAGGRRSYRLITMSAEGTRDYTALAGNGSIALWRRAHPTERVVLQRFVAPGYYLTGKITAIADSAGSVMTRYHPDSGTHYEAMYAAVGFLIFACILALLLL